MVSPEEAAWLAAYEAGRDGAGRDVGASSRRVVHVEEHQAVGTGGAAEVAAAAAMAREEGRRLDHILDRSITMLTRAIEAYERMTASLLKERQSDAETHRALLDSLRTHFLARAEAEAELVRADVDRADAGIEGAVAKMLIDRMTTDPKPGA